MAGDQKEGPEEMKTVFVFPDTNIFLHYPPLKQTDWRSLIPEADQIKLVVCMHVINELDPKKSDSSLGSRAQRAIKELEDHPNGGEIQPNVSLEIYDQEIRHDDFPVGRSPNSGDDIIICQVLSFMRRNEGAEGKVYSADFGMQLRCKSKIGILKPDVATRLPNPTLEYERKYKELLAKQQDTKPSIDVLNDIVSHERQARGLWRIWRKPTILDAEAEFQKTKNQMLLGIPKDDYQFYVSQQGGTTRREWLKYEQDAQTYLTNFETWLARWNQNASLFGPCFAFGITLANNGRMPAHHLEVTLKFPPILATIRRYGGDLLVGNLDDITSPSPSPPERPLTVREKALDARNSHARYFASVASEHNPPPPDVHGYGTFQDGFQLVLKLKELKHHKQWSFGNFVSMFLREKDHHTFNVECRITADNIPDIETSKLTFKDFRELPPEG
jgi:hypothetical protein